MYRHALETAEQFRQLYCCEPVRLIFVTAYDDIGKQLRGEGRVLPVQKLRQGREHGRPGSGRDEPEQRAWHIPLDCPGVKVAGADRFQGR